MTDVAALVREAREEYEAGYEKAYKRIPDLCDALEERERKVERLRDALQGLYEAAHTTWMNGPIEDAVVEAREALAAREREESD